MALWSRMDVPDWLPVEFSQYIVSMKPSVSRVRHGMAAWDGKPKVRLWTALGRSGHVPVAG